MHNNNFVYWVLLSACLAAGFISGWTIKGCGSESKSIVNSPGGILKVHDTIKTPVLEYKFIPGREYNVDSLINVVSQFWKDSLKNLYGKGLFETKFVKQDNTGKREITLESRTPVDPEAEVSFDEELKLPEVYPKHNFSIFGGLGYDSKLLFTSAIGLKYFIMDFRNFSLCGSGIGKYLINSKTWIPCGIIEAEVKF